jgi:transposase
LDPARVARKDGEVKMSIVMGIDQHRAQITAEWIELDSGEIGRARVRPADRGGVRRFLSRFAGQHMEVALEATTGWRFVVEELRAAGAEVHLAEPAETSALRGNKKRAKSDRADARHLRELLLAGRLPESWIPPDHVLDLRARVRLRHTLIKQHSEYQQRIQAVLYHHGCPRRRGLMVGDGREWLAGQPLPETAREQIAVALAMIDALEVQIAPLDRELRAYARAQTGCRALIDAYYGIGELTAVTIISELGDCRRFSNSRDVVRYGGMEMVASNCASCSGDLGLVADMGGFCDPLATVLFDVGAEWDSQAAAVAVCGELAVADPVVDHVG